MNSIFKFLTLFILLFMTPVSWGAGTSDDEFKIGNNSGTLEKRLCLNRACTNVIRVPSGGGDIQFSDDGVGFKSISSISANDPGLIENAGLAASVGSSALTISLKIADGSTDPISGNAVKFSFRDATESSGGYLIRSITSALSIVVPSGATLGHTSAGSDEGEIIYIYALDNAGTVELAVSSVNTFLEDRVHTTTAIDGTADDRDILYSTTLRSNVSVRLIGKAFAQQTTAGTWAAVPTRLTPTNSFLDKPHVYILFKTDAGQSFTNGVSTTVDFEDLLYKSHTSSVTTGASWKFEPPIDGVYDIHTCIRFDSLTDGTGSIQTHIRKNGTINFLAENAIANTAESTCVSAEIFLLTTDDIDLQGRQDNGVARTLVTSQFSNFISIRLKEAR